MTPCQKPPMLAAVFCLCDSSLFDWADPNGVPSPASCGGSRWVVGRGQSPGCAKPELNLTNTDQTSRTTHMRGVHLHPKPSQTPQTPPCSRLAGRTGHWTRYRRSRRSSTGGTASARSLSAWATHHRGHTQVSSATQRTTRTFFLIRRHSLEGRSEVGSPPPCVPGWRLGMGSSPVHPAISWL